MTGLHISSSLLTERCFVSPFIFVFNYISFHFLLRFSFKKAREKGFFIFDYLFIFINRKTKVDTKSKAISVACPRKCKIYFLFILSQIRAVRKLSLYIYQKMTVLNRYDRVIRILDNSKNVECSSTREKKFIIRFGIKHNSGFLMLKLVLFCHNLFKKRPENISSI